MIPTSSRQHPFSRPHRRLLWAAAIALATCNVSNAGTEVLVTSQILGGSGSIYQYDRAGNPLGTLDVMPGGKLFSSIATDGSRLIAGRAFDGFRTYSLDGTFHGYLPGLPTTNELPYVEFDAHGNIYLLGVGAPRRLNPDGSPSLTFPGGTGNGIDADAAGNVYVARSSGLQKYSSTGALLASTTFPGSAADIAIDDLGQTLYLTSGSNNGSGSQTEIRAYDISGAAPSFVGSFAASSTATGISFDPASGHLFAADLFGGYAREMRTDGFVVRQFSLPEGHAIDVVAIHMPEASSLTLLVMAVACGPRRLLRRRRK